MCSKIKCSEIKSCIGFLAPEQEAGRLSLGRGWGAPLEGGRWAALKKTGGRRDFPTCKGSASRAVMLARALQDGKFWLLHSPAFQGGAKHKAQEETKQQPKAGGSCGDQRSGAASVNRERTIRARMAARQPPAQQKKKKESGL